MKNDVMPMSDSIETSFSEADINKDANVIADGSANDKAIGKYILKTARQTDALIEQQACKKLHALLDKAVMCRN